MNSHYYKFIIGPAGASPPIIIIISHTIGDADLREKEDNTKTKYRGNEEKHNYEVDISAINDSCGE